MIEVKYEWKINDFSTQQIGRDEHGELWFQSWNPDIGAEPNPGGWQMYHPHHGGIEAEELLRLAEQPSASVDRRRLEAASPRLDELLSICEALATERREGEPIIDGVRRLLAELEERREAQSSVPLPSALRNLVKAAMRYLGPDRPEKPPGYRELLNAIADAMNALKARHAADDPEVANCIAFLEHCRQTHVDWKAWIEAHPEEAQAPVPQVTTAGSPAEHQECIVGYDRVLDLIGTLRSRREAGGVDVRAIRAEIASLREDEDDPEFGALCRGIADRLAAALRGAGEGGEAVAGAVRKVIADARAWLWKRVEAPESLTQDEEPQDFVEALVDRLDAALRGAGKRQELIQQTSRALREAAAGAYAGTELEQQCRHAADTIDSLRSGEQAAAEARPQGLKPCTCSSHQFVECRGVATLGAGWYCAQTGERGRHGGGLPDRVEEEVQLGVIELHPKAALREDFYRVVDDLRASASIVDVWLRLFRALRSGEQAGAEPHPRVQGRCQSCGSATLFLGARGYVTCSLIGCKAPTSASSLLADPEALATLQRYSSLRERVEEVRREMSAAIEGIPHAGACGATAIQVHGWLARLADPAPESPVAGGGLPKLAVEPRCHCGKAATCIGSYEGQATPTYACDDCCGHGCEDGQCEPIRSPAPEPATTEAEGERCERCHGQRDDPEEPLCEKCEDEVERGILRAHTRVVRRRRRELCRFAAASLAGQRANGGGDPTVMPHAAVVDALELLAALNRAEKEATE